MTTKIINIETALSQSEVTERLKSMTITDFAQIHRALPVTYYGEIGADHFALLNVKYGPMSSMPPIKGEIVDGMKHTIVRVGMDVEEQYRIARKMYYSTLIPIGLIVLLLSALVLAGTAFQIHGIVFSATFILCAILVAILTRTSLYSARKKEIREFAGRIDGKIVAESLGEFSESFHVIEKEHAFS